MFATEALRFSYINSGWLLCDFDDIDERCHIFKKLYTDIFWCFIYLLVCQYCITREVGVVEVAVPFRPFSS